MEQADDVEDDPVLLRKFKDGATKKAKTENAWGTSQTGQKGQFFIRV